MRYRFLTADVFTDRIHGGNPLAVFPDAKGLDTERMQATAKELNLSETVFVFPPDVPAHTRKLRIFTPGAELPFAGHPTVGTAYVLAALGEIPLVGRETRIVFEEGVGPVPVVVRAEEGRPVFAQLSAAKMPEVGPPPPDAATLARVLSLEARDLVEARLASRAVSCGVPFLFVPVRDRDALGRVEIDPGAWKAHLSGYWAPHVFALTDDPELAGSDVRARMFAPAMGITEDPATGAAATALAGFLGEDDGVEDGTLRWVVEQGFEMGRPSILQVEADKKAGKIVAIRVGGASVLVSEGEMEIPS
jgi:trans-2,3-dihydro-3-hydroxyanthranilate isomerase